MSNTINLLPVRTSDQLKNELKKFKYDFITAIIILAVVIVGVLIMFANAFVQWNIANIEGLISTANTTLKSYSKLANGYFIVDQKVIQASKIKNNRINPVDMIDYINSLLPTAASLSNLIITDDSKFTVTISSTSYVDVAKLLFSLENPNIRLKNTEINAISYSPQGNIFNFVISGTYVSATKNG